VHPPAAPLCAFIWETLPHTITASRCCHRNVSRNESWLYLKNPCATPFSPCSFEDCVTTATPILPKKAQVLKKICKTLQLQNSRILVLSACARTESPIRGGATAAPGSRREDAAGRGGYICRASRENQPALRSEGQGGGRTCSESSGVEGW